MAKSQFENNPNLEEKPPTTNDDLKDNITKLANKIDKLAKKIDLLEKKFTNLIGATSSKATTGEDVEVGSSELEEDFLAPTMLFAGENPAVFNTAIELTSLTIATASEISNITKKDRAVESFYLNDLNTRNKIRKLRIGRKIYFYIGNIKNIKPFKNPIIKPEWREVLLAIIREAKERFNKKIKIDKLIVHYFQILLPEDEKDTIMDENTKKVLLNELKQKLQDITNETNFLKINDDEQEIEFLIDKWIQLGN